MKLHRCSRCGTRIYVEDSFDRDEDMALCKRCDDNLRVEFDKANGDA